MIMSSDKGYSWSAEHLLPVDFEEGQGGCKSVHKQVDVVCCVVLLRIKFLTHATHAHTTEHIISHIRIIQDKFYCLMLEDETISNIFAFISHCISWTFSISTQLTIAQSTFEIQVFKSC